jgi:hypothetical protein
MACLAKAGAGTHVAVSRIAVPKIGDQSVAYRISYDTKLNGKPTRMALEVASVLKGRAEISVSEYMLAPIRVDLLHREVVRLARIMGSRAPS